MFEKIISKNPGENDPNAGPQAARSHGAPATPPQSSSPAPSRPAPSNGQRNVLLPDVEITGRVSFQNDLIVDGKIEGEIVSEGSLTIGENAKIKAEIMTSSVVVYGKVHGNITVTDRIELRKDAEVIGDIKAAILTMEAGAIFVGSSTVGAPSDTAAAKQQQQAKQQPQQQPQQQQPKPNQGKPAGAS